VAEKQADKKAEKAEVKPEVKAEKPKAEKPKADKPKADKPKVEKGSFGEKFLAEMRAALEEERVRLSSSADRLQAEADSLMADVEPGDVQFDDESGEGDTLAVERERDLALSAQARETIADIDAALARLDAGTYGYSLLSGKPIPKERLEAIPWATELVEEKVGGLGRR
jgi:RNA polymerase-binding transcription factor DksA